ncbi:HNH endonuclease family protein [Gordonia sp. ABSL49_1]|nr:HNH endonuclease family protein [Gordonia sp. ABSL49_1]MCH5643062.1 HNH endonuclease family protein [Gordonia sp. ABSL49_1]
MRRWCVLSAFVVTALFVATGVMVNTAQTGVDERVRARAQRLTGELGALSVSAARRHREDYQRSAFGTPWSDEVRVRGGSNGCDTRNDILARDLHDTRRGPTKTCPGAVLAGEFRSPYTGDYIVFRRDLGAAAVQIDHIVPLAYAWDMGAWAWPAELRQDFANDPANLVAVDGGSNQDKSDAEPARWMPDERGFWCQYAVQFVIVVRSYGLAIDAASRDVLADALRCR